MDQILALLLTYKYWVLFPLSVIEGPIMTIIAGFLVSTNVFNPVWAYIIVFFGDFFGDIFFYVIGRWGNKLFSSKIGLKLGATPEKIALAKERFIKHRIKTIVLSKTLNGIGVAGLIAAGTLKIPFGKYLQICIITTLVKSGILLIVGIFFGHAYLQLNKYLDYFAAITIILAILIGLFFFIKKKFKFNLEK